VAKKRKKKRSSKTKSRLGAPFFLPEWYTEGLDGWSTEEIFTRLREYGLALDEETYRRDVEDCDEPSLLAERWIARVTTDPGDWEDFIHFAVRELWRRFFPVRDCVEFLVDDLRKYMERDVDPLGIPLPEAEVMAIMRDLERLDGLLEQRRHGESKSLKDLFHEVFDEHLWHVSGWLTELPMELSWAGFVDEAVTIARRYAFLDPSNMLGDVGHILASSGRCQEALAQVEENLRDMPDDTWVLIKAGDVFEDCGHSERAVELYRQALGMAEDGHARDGVYERLVPLYERLGRSEEAEELARGRDRERAEVDDTPAPPRSAPSVKVGRNSPCPCGSGKKFKKCCLDKTPN
jgi:hypothetical protein